MQETRVWSLIQEDPTYCGTKKPGHHNYSACALEPGSCNHWAHMLQLLKSACPRGYAPQKEKSLQWEACTQQPERGNNGSKNLTSNRTKMKRDSLGIALEIHGLERSCHNVGETWRLWTPGSVGWSWAQRPRGLWRRRKAAWWTKPPTMRRSWNWFGRRTTRTCCCLWPPSSSWPSSTPPGPGEPEISPVSAAIFNRVPESLFPCSLKLEKSPPKHSQK